MKRSLRIECSSDEEQKFGTKEVVKTIQSIPILLLIFVLNIKEEDEYLLNEFGEEYLRYKKNVKLLIPKLL